MPIQRADAWIVEVIVLVMMMIMIKNKDMNKNDRDDNDNRLCSFLCHKIRVIPNFMSLISSHFCRTHFAIFQTDRTAAGLSCMSQQ